MDEPGTYRFRWSCQIVYGHYADFFEIQQRKQELAATKGWRGSSLWVATSGNLNDFFEERDYDTYEALAHDLSVREGDYDYMRLMRSSYKLLVQGSVRTEFFRTATPV